MHPLDPDDFEAALDDYNLRIGDPSKSALRSWTLFTAAAGAALCASSSAEAAIVYSGVQNITRTVDAPTASDWLIYTAFMFDVNGDFIVDLRLEIAGQLIQGSGYSSYIFFAGAAPAVISGIGWVSGTGSSGWLRRMTSASFVSAGQNFQFYAGIFGTANGAPQLGAEFAANSTGFAGMRFKIGGNTHYGWVQIKAGDSGGGGGFLTVIDWAYEDTPDTPIQVGAVVPEPSALSLLALGIAGLGIYRRKRMCLMTTECSCPPPPPAPSPRLGIGIQEDFQVPRGLLALGSPILVRPRSGRSTRQMLGLAGALDHPVARHPVPGVAGPSLMEIEGEGQPVVLVHDPVGGEQRTRLDARGAERRLELERDVVAFVGEPVQPRNLRGARPPSPEGARFDISSLFGPEKPS